MLGIPVSDLSYALVEPIVVLESNGHLSVSESAIGPALSEGGAFSFGQNFREPLWDQMRVRGQGENMGILRKLGLGKGDDEQAIIVKLGRGEIEFSEYESREEQTPVVRLIVMLVKCAVKSRAKILRILPTKDAMEILMVVGNQLIPLPPAPHTFGVEALEGFKTMAGIAASGNDRARSGRIRPLLLGQHITATVLSLPGQFGSSVEIQFDRLPDLELIGSDD